VSDDQRGLADTSGRLIAQLSRTINRHYLANAATTLDERGLEYTTVRTISWKHPCCVCQRPIQRGKPTILLATDSPMMVGICHSTCGYRRLRYGLFHMCPPEHLSDEQVSFLVQSYYRLFSLPGGQKPNRELRICLSTFLQDYPASMIDPMASLRKFLDEYKLWSHEWLYEGDLEMDFLRILAQLQEAAKADPTGVELDFRT
jgi:hypothetical protein